MILLLDKADISRSGGSRVWRWRGTHADPGVTPFMLKVGYVAWPIDDCAERLDLRVEALETIATIVERHSGGRVVLRAVSR